MVNASDFCCEMVSDSIHDNLARGIIKIQYRALLLTSLHQGCQYMNRDQAGCMSLKKEQKTPQTFGLSPIPIWHLIYSTARLRFHLF